MAEDSPKSGEGNQAVPADMPRQGAGSHDVFVSYASQDAVIANAVVTTLERAGLSCWIAPRDVVPGSLYADEIVGAINEAKVVVLVLSQHSVASPHVGKEIERASSKRRRIIAFHMDSTPLTRGFEYFLSESQWIDVGTGGMDAAIAKLVEAVRRHLDPSAAIESRAQPDPPTVAAKVPRTRWMVAGGAVLLVALAYFVVEKFWLPRRAADEKPVTAAVPASVSAAPAIPDKSVAVLPFVDMSEKKDQEYFSDGMSEELINLLTKLPDLRVPARTSAFYFKGKQVAVADIAHALDVGYVLEGSVRKSGKTLRVTAQLIRADNGYHVWSETYDRRMKDVFKVQDDIADAVVKALKATLIGSSAVRTPPTTNIAAYSLYLQSQAIWNSDLTDQYGLVVKYLREALKLDPNLALAWAQLSRAYTDEFRTETNRPYQMVRADAIAAAQRSLKLDPTLPEAHLAMADIYIVLDFDWDAAETELSRARQLGAGIDAVRFAIRLADIRGEHDQALRLAEAVVEQDPVNAASYLSLGIVQCSMGRFLEAEAAFRKALEFAPNFGAGHAYVGYALLAQGKSTEALAEMEREADEDWRRAYLPLAHDALGRKAEADAELAVLESKYAAAWPSQIAAIYARRNDFDRAFLWLDRAYQQRDYQVARIKVDWLVSNLRGDPRYKALLRKMKLPE
jgi:TolB-like protein/cytochrome c-type biogenesis protein CcmH/NrfG